MLVAYFGNVFNRTTPDPFRNYSGDTQFTDNGLSDVDRRGSDRGIRFISDAGDTYPGSVILKSTPSLLAPAPGPESKRTAMWMLQAECCPDQIEEEPDVDCIEDTVDYLNDLPTPSNYEATIRAMPGPCTETQRYLCNYHEVIVRHMDPVLAACDPGIDYTPGATGTCCGPPGPVWCEKYVFPTCAAALAFWAYIYPLACNINPTAVVGEHSIFNPFMGTACDTGTVDENCGEGGCLLHPDEQRPMAYSRGGVGDTDCGEISGREPADEDSSFVGFYC